MRRWVCPTCGSGANAPERPRKNDARRYCLDCSAKTGFLVERRAPALEARRATTALRSKDRAAVKREAGRQRWIVRLPDANDVARDLDVRSELRQALRDCGFFDGWARGQAPTIDEIEVIIRRGQKPHHSGRAWESSFRVALTFGKAGHEDALELIYHEAAHVASQTGVGHGPEFHRRLADALQKRWPWLIYGSIRPNGGTYYSGERIRRQLRDYVRNGGKL